MRRPNRFDLARMLYFDGFGEWIDALVLLDCHARERQEFTVELGLLFQPVLDRRFIDVGRYAHISHQRVLGKNGRSGFIDHATDLMRIDVLAGHIAEGALHTEETVAGDKAIGGD